MNNLCYWDSVAKEIVGSQKAKAKKFNKEKCVIRLDENTFKVLPIKGYNTTAYIVKNNYDGWGCNCQWNVKNKLNCSHILAVSLFLKNNEGKGVEK